MAGDIVPIELGLTNGDVVTLWAPHWRDGDEDWQAFLGRDEDLFVFASVAELAAFIRSDNSHDLAEHPSWRVVAALSAAELEPTEEHSYDLVGVPELAASDPEPLIVAELEETLAIARSIGEVCDLEVVNSFFDDHPALGALPTGHYAFSGREGEQLWTAIGKAVASRWDDVLNAIDTIVSTPDVDEQIVAECEAELVAATENDIDADDAADEDEDIEVITDEDDFWSEVGIDPIRISTSVGTFYSLRCYLDDTPVFLGRDGQVFVFRSERALARYLADSHDHDLASVATYGEIMTAATDGSLDIVVTPENSYVFTGLAEDITAGPSAVDAEQLDLAVELLTDAADFVGDGLVEEALATSTPLGWFVSYALNPDPTRMAPSAPFAAEASEWKELENWLEGRLQVQ